MAAAQAQENELMALKKQSLAARAIGRLSWLRAMGLAADRSHEPELSFGHPYERSLPAEANAVRNDSAPLANFLSLTALSTSRLLDPKS
jgi:hypothetical protein